MPVPASKNDLFAVLVDFFRQFCHIKSFVRAAYDYQNVRPTRSNILIEGAQGDSRLRRGRVVVVVHLHAIQFAHELQASLDSLERFKSSFDLVIREAECLKCRIRERSVLPIVLTYDF